MRFLSQHSPVSKKCLAALAGLAALPLLTFGGVTGAIGSLPSADDGMGAQNFYLALPPQLAEDIIEDASGTGHYVATSFGNLAWIEFYGDVTVTLNKAALDQHRNQVELGVSAGVVGGGMMLVPEFDGQMGHRKIDLAAGSVLETPLGRMGSLFTSNMVLHTLQVNSLERGSVSYSNVGGELIIRQDVD